MSFNQKDEYAAIYGWAIEMAIRHGKAENAEDLVRAAKVLIEGGKDYIIKETPDESQH